MTNKYVGMDRMIEEKKRLDYKYLLIFALLQFPLKISGIRILTYVYIYFIPFIYLIINIKWTRSFFRRFRSKAGKTGFLIFAYLIVASILWPFLTGSYDFTYITIYWRGIFSILLKYTFLTAIYELHICKERPSVEEFCNYYIYSVMIYVFVTAICLCIPVFNDLLRSIVHLEPGDIVNLQNPSYRTRFGWGGGSGYGVTMQCTLAVVFCCNRIILEKGSLRNQIKYFFFSGILIVGNAFYGRTGLVISLICIVITTVVSFIQGEIRYALVVVGTLIFGGSILLVFGKNISAVSTWLDWIFSAITNYRRLGHFYDNTGTVETLVTKMYWMPDIKTLFLGDGIYTVNGEYYMKTDAGIMRPILYYGIINYALSLGAYFLIVYQYSKRVVQDNVNQFSRKYVNIIFGICVVMTMVFEIKGESFWMLLGMLCPIALLKKNVEMVKNNDQCCNECIQ